jgi:hypothetical protein
MTLLRVAGWTAAGVLGIGALTGVAAAVSGAAGTGPASSGTVELAEAAQTPDAATTATPGKDSDAKGRRHPLRQRLLRRTLHGEVVVRTKDGPQTFDLQRGTITAVSSSAMTVRSTDGFTETWAINDDTKIRKDRKAAGAGALKAGDQVRVVGPKSGSGATARHIGARTPKPPAGEPGGSGTPS